jgi:transcription termination factor Rho
LRKKPQRNHRSHKARFTNKKPSKRSNAYAEFLLNTSIDPHERLCLEKTNGPLSMRMVNLIAPIGKGQRGLIVAPPKTGKTTLLQEISIALAANHPEVKSYCLLIEERPEEVTDFTRSVPGEVVASSADHDTDHHIKTANDLLEKAINEVNQGTDVVILLDSLTRLARVHNRKDRSGKILSGGMGADAMEMPRRFFGAARKLEEGGSLTIIATALVETGSKMDEHIFQEFKGTGNMELVLSRKSAEARLFPALDINASGTRKEEKLLSAPECAAIHKMRSYLASMKPEEALKKLIDTLEKYKSNEDFIAKFQSSL